MRWAGFLLPLGMIAGILSVVPVIDAPDYLSTAAANPGQVYMGALFQLLMACIYLGFAIVLYPTLKALYPHLAIGFLSFRIAATTLVLLGTTLLIALLTLSQESIGVAPENELFFESMGQVLKSTRDAINHIFMILVWCVGNFLLYVLFFRSQIVPQWLSVWGILGTLFSFLASILVLFKVVEIISADYLMLNVPTAILELVLGIWLMSKGNTYKEPLEKSAA